MSLQALNLSSTKEEDIVDSTAAKIEIANGDQPTNKIVKELETSDLSNPEKADSGDHPPMLEKNVTDVLPGPNWALTTCSICQEAVLGENPASRAVAKLYCGHRFHLDCIGSLFNSKRSMECPDCGIVEPDREWLYGEESPRDDYDDSWVDDDDDEDYTNYYYDEDDNLTPGLEEHEPLHRYAHYVPVYDDNGHLAGGRDVAGDVAPYHHVTGPCTLDAYVYPYGYVSGSPYNPVAIPVYGFQHPIHCLPRGYPYPYHHQWFEYAGGAVNRGVADPRSSSRYQYPQRDGFRYRMLPPPPPFP